MSVIFTRRGPAPSTSIALSNFEEGSIVYINESGSPVPFYVAKHDYEPDLNGSGRTLLLRKNSWKAQSMVYMRYTDSNVDNYLNSTYISLLDDVLQAAIGKTKFRCCYRYVGNYEDFIAEGAIFVLSATEYGLVAESDGTKIPVATEHSKAIPDGSASGSHWTRTPFYDENANVTMPTTSYYYVNADGYCRNDTSGNTQLYVRPALTLPAMAMFDPETNEFISA